MKLFIAVIVLSTTLLTSLKSQEQINWVSMQEALMQNTKQPKKVLIYVYTSWCGYCKKMSKTTYADSSVISYINKNYYAVKLDAESKEEITLGNTTYKYIPRGNKGYQELAVQLLDNHMVFPSTAILNEKNQKFAPIAGYIDASTFNKILHYYGDNAYLSTAWDDYNPE